MALLILGPILYFELHSSNSMFLFSFYFIFRSCMFGCGFQFADPYHKVSTTIQSPTQRVQGYRGCNIIGFYCLYQIKSDCIAVANCNLVHDVETIC